MRQGPNGRRPRGRHHGGGSGGGQNHTGGGNGGSGGGNGNHVASNPMGGGNRPRSAAALRHQTFDSNCIDMRVRGNAWQVHEKYQALARDAQSSGDRVAAENFLQHAEHYFRIIEAINEATAAEQRARGVPPTPYGQQPEMPNNYYTGNDASQPGAEQPGGNGPNVPGMNQPAQTHQGQQQPQMAQAEVQPRHTPPSFFTNEEIEANEGPAPLVAQR